MLRLDWCNHAAAKYAVEHWHYSRKMPVGKHVRIGVWEAGEFKGVMVFAHGSNNHIGSPYGLTAFECVELIRVALREHEAPVSRLLAVGCRMLKRHCPGLRLIVSYADPNVGHHGGIYQAANWIYTGQTGMMKQHNFGGVWYHERSCRRSSNWRPKSVPAVVPKDCPTRITVGRYRYLFPLDAGIREQIASLARPYPSRGRSADSGTPGDQSGGGGANPTRSLLLENA